MKELTAEKYLKDHANIYALVILAARRTMALTRGSKRLISQKRHLKPAVTALAEIAHGKLALVPQEEVKDEKNDKDETEK